MFKNTYTEYVASLIKSTGQKNFSSMAKESKTSADTMFRFLRPSEEINAITISIAKKEISKFKTIVCAIDDTMLKKTYAQAMEGAKKHYDTKIFQSVTSYKIQIMAISDGKNAIALQTEFMISENMSYGLFKEAVTHQMIKKAKELFPDQKIIFSADGAFSTVNILKQCVETNTNVEMRMHSNRVVTYKNEDISLKKIRDLKLKGRQKSRTIKIKWHDINLYITAELRTDKYGNRTIVYLVSTYFAKPNVHVKNYKKRWPIEKLFRTCKQYLGLNECRSRKLEIQKNHVASVFLAHAFLIFEMKKRKLKTPEDALRALKLKKVDFLNAQLSSFRQIFGDIYA